MDCLDIGNRSHELEHHASLVELNGNTTDDIIKSTIDIGSYNVYEDIVVVRPFKLGNPIEFRGVRASPIEPCVEVRGYLE